jgi:hypothetical protein
MEAHESRPEHQAFLDSLVRLWRDPRTRPKGEQADRIGNPYLRRILKAYIPAALGEIARRFRPDCCIAATRLTQLVLREFHFKVEPLPVRLLALNEAGAEYVDALQQGPVSEEAVDAWQAKGAWMVDIGRPGMKPEPGRWPGHLVALINGGVLLDLTAPQASRPDRGILVDVLCLEVPAEFVSGELEWRAAALQGEVAMHIAPNDKYRLGPDWYSPERYREIVPRIVDQIRLSLKRRK